MLTSMKSILNKANKGKYAVGAFNVNNLEIFQAVMRAAEKLKSPVIIQTSEGAIHYAGINALHNMISSTKTKIPFALHLDHGRDLDLINQCIKTGYTSVMIDASHYPFEKNIRVTKKVVIKAQKKGVTVEGELGTIGGAEEAIISRTIQYTDPEKAKEFVEKTGVDALAIAIGTSHGPHKFSGTPHLRLELVKEIKNKLRIPLVLHGASALPKETIQRAITYGFKTDEPMEGVPEDQLKTAIYYGINKINTDTELRLTFIASIRETLAKKPEIIDPRLILGPARDEIQQIVEHRIKVFGSTGKA